jgi:TonB family protein
VIDFREGIGKWISAFKQPAKFKKGRVLLEVVIDKKGNVIHARLITSKYPQLNKSVLDAVMQFKFDPYLKDNVPRSVRFKLTLYCFL